MQNFKSQLQQQLINQIDKKQIVYHQVFQEKIHQKEGINKVMIPWKVREAKLNNK